MRVARRAKGGHDRRDIDFVGVVPPKVRDELVRHAIHARPLLFRKVGAEGDAQRISCVSTRDDALEEFDVLPGHDRPAEDASRPARVRDAPARSGAPVPPSACRSRAATPTASSSARSRPASATTYGISPLVEAITATPDAKASISMRPNCSRQRGVV